MTTTTASSKKNTTTTPANGKAPTAAGSKPGTRTPITTAHGGTSQGAGSPTPKPPESTPARGAKLGPARKMERNVSRLLKRWDSFVRKAKGWSASIDVAMGEARDAIASAHLDIAKLPDDFKGPRKSPGTSKAPLAVGSKVDLTDKAIAAYKDILEPSDMKGLVVHKVGEKKMLFKTSEGSILTFKRQEVKPVEG